MACVLYEMKEYNKAKPYVEEYLKTNKDSFSMTNLMILILYSNGEYKNVKKYEEQLRTIWKQTSDESIKKQAFFILYSFSYDKYEIDTEKLNKMVEVKAASNTEVMNITATSKDPKLSADIANEMVSVFKKKIFDIMSVENVTVLNSAKIPTKPSGPSVLKNTAIGMMIGAVLCGIYAVIVLLTDTKVKTEEDVKKIFDYPVIGVIPEFKVEERGKDND